MINTFKYTALSLIKEKSILIWAVAFPLILATLFNLMFADLDEAFRFKPIPAAAVVDTHYRGADAFIQMVDILAKPGDDQVLDLQQVTNTEEAKQLLADGAILGYFLINDVGDPELFVTSESVIGGSDAINQTILKDVLDSFVRNRAMVEMIVEKNPLALIDSPLLTDLYERKSFTEEINIIANEASTATRYFYALLGFGSIMVAQIAMIAISRTQANLSALGARRAVGATGRVKTLVATLLASWALAFACLLIVFIYVRFALGINFGRDLAAIFGLFVASCMATAVGTFIGSIPKLGEGIKVGILTGLSCTLGLFAGLYGTPSMQLADEMARTAPLFQTLNPARQVTDLFYSLYYYDGYEHFFEAVLILLAIAVVLLVVAALFMRRQRYASL